MNNVTGRCYGRVPKNPNGKNDKLIRCNQPCGNKQYCSECYIRLFAKPIKAERK